MLESSSSTTGSRKEHEKYNDSIPFHKKPLYIWVKSFSDEESSKEEDSFGAFVIGNALSYALEYVGITPESEQSSLHLSAIFDEFEESQQQSRNKYPNHYESETKNRIQNLNRMFNELKSYFEDHFCQLVALKPPNSVHIVSACQSCAVQELEKLLFLLLGAAIQSHQKQETIKKIKRFPSDVQEALIEHIKLIQDNPDILHIKSWTEFSNLETEERQKIYEGLLSLIRRLLFDRNQITQSQLMSEYFQGFMHCGQKRIYEGKGFGPESDYEDTRFNGALRQLKEELHEKSDLLQECREELEVSRNQVQELQSELMELSKEIKACKKARDELDALREGQEKASRLEAEVQRMKKKLQDSEQYFERVEVLEVENRGLQLQNESLLEQNSFLTIEKESLKMLINSSDPVLDLSSRNTSYSEKNTLEISNVQDDDDDQDFSLDLPDTEHDLHLEDNNFPLLDNEEDQIKNDVTNEEECSKSNDNLQLEEEEEDDDDETEIKEIQHNAGGKSQELEEEEQQVPSTVSKKQEGSSEKRIKRRRRRSSLINVKRTRRTILFPYRGTQKLLPISSGIGNNENTVGEKSSDHRSVAIKVIKVCHAPNSKRKCCSHAQNRRSKSLRRRQAGAKQRTAHDMENDADEESLSVSPDGPPNLSDIENFENPEVDERRNGDSEVYFVCSNSTTRNVNNTNKEEEEEEEEQQQQDIVNEYTEKTFPVNGKVNNNNNIPLKLSNGSHCLSTMEVPHTNHLSQEFLSINTKNIEINFNDCNNTNEQEHCTCHTCVGNTDNDVLQDVGFENEILPSSEPLYNPRLCVNVNSVENYSTHINLNLNNIVQYERPTNEFSNNNNIDSFPDSFVLSKNNENIIAVHESSSSEDDDSVWYEYGCV